MPTYRDMTFCSGARCVKFAACPRALTPAVKFAARKWWGGAGAPICNFSRPREQSCYEAPARGFAKPETPTP